LSHGPSVARKGAKGDMRRDPTRWGHTVVRRLELLPGIKSVVSMQTKGPGRVSRRRRQPAWVRGQRKSEARARHFRRQALANLRGVG